MPDKQEDKKEHEAREARGTGKIEGTVLDTTGAEGGTTLRVTLADWREREELTLDERIARIESGTDLKGPVSKPKPEATLATELRPGDRVEVRLVKRVAEVEEEKRKDEAKRLEVEQKQLEQEREAARPEAERRAAMAPVHPGKQESPVKK